MSLLNITEWRGIQAFWTPASAQVAMSLVTTQSLSISATSTTCVAFNANTSIVRLQSDVNCAIAWGVGTASIATAVATSMPLTANAPEYFGVVPGQLLAAITV